MSRRICVLALVAVCVAVASANPFFLGGGKGGKGNSGGGDSYGAPSYGAPSTNKPSYESSSGKTLGECYVRRLLLVVTFFQIPYGVTLTTDC